MKKKHSVRKFCEKDDLTEKFNRNKRKTQNAPHHPRTHTHTHKTKIHREHHGKTIERC